MFETLFFSPVVYIFSSVLRPNLVIFTSDLVVQWSNFKLQNPENSYTVNSQFLGIFFSLQLQKLNTIKRGFFFIHVSSYSWILLRVWDLQLIHDKALVCCCRSFHQKYYLKKRVFIIRIDIIIRHWKKTWKKPLLDCHCQSVGMSYYNCACKPFFKFYFISTIL